VGSRKVGEKIFFQGGVANNKGVVAAFEQVTGKPIIIPPNFDVTGAIGMAILAREKVQETNQTKFKGFDVRNASFTLDKFTCKDKDCKDLCEIRMVKVKGEKKPFCYGGRCEKYEMSDRKKQTDDTPNLFEERERMLLGDYDEEKKRISLSLKKLLPHPWENIESRLQIGDKVSGRVVSLTEYGAFIEIEKGIEGLIHNSEMSWTQHVKHPSQVVAMGQIVEAVVLSLDKEEKKISLGIKQLEPDPWQTLMQKYPVGSQHSGIARNLTNFGVFIELEPGVDGLVHISDLSWTKKIRHPGEVVKKGERLDVTVLGVDVDQRKISLGHKQIHDNPWDTFEATYGVGAITQGKVVRIIEKGLIAELPDKVDGFVPATLLTPAKIKNLANHFPVDDIIPLKVIEFDKENKKIVLSALAVLKDRPEEEIRAYLDKHKMERVSVSEIQSAETTAIDASEFPIFDVPGESPIPPAELKQ